MRVGERSRGMRDRVRGSSWSWDTWHGVHWGSGGISSLKRQSGFAQGCGGIIIQTSNTHVLETCGCGTRGHGGTWV